MRLKDLPLEERPREKALRYGVQKLSTEELFALILGSGVKNHSVLEIANKLLSNFKGLDGLARANVKDIMSVKGLSRPKALIIMAIFEILLRMEKIAVKNTEKIVDSKQIFMKYQYQFSLSSQENVLVVLLNNTNRIIKEDLLYKGVGNEVNISIREIMNLLVKHNAAKFILVHNHPSGDTFPSNSDITVTKKIKEAAKLLGINFLDHIIIANYNYYSFCEHDMI